MDNKNNETAAKATESKQEAVQIRTSRQIDQTISNLCKLIDKQMDAGIGHYESDLPRLVLATAKMIEASNRFIV